MKTAMTVTLMSIRLLGLALIVMGMLLWTGSHYSLLPEHMLVGVVFVILLWLLGPLAMGSGVQRGIVVLLVLWGGLVLALGMVQRQLLIGDAHWVIRVLHFLAGLVAMALAERVAGIAKRARAGTPR